jgi:aspartate aminotransferase-like enzyme
MGTMGDISEVDVVGALGALERVLRDRGHTSDPGVASTAALEVFTNAAADRTLAVAAR